MGAAAFGSVLGVSVSVPVLAFQLATTPVSVLTSLERASPSPAVKPALMRTVAIEKLLLSVSLRARSGLCLMAASPSL